MFWKKKDKEIQKLKNENEFLKEERSLLIKDNEKRGKQIVQLMGSVDLEVKEKEKLKKMCNDREKIIDRFKNEISLKEDELFEANVKVNNILLRLEILKKENGELKYLKNMKYLLKRKKPKLVGWIVCMKILKII